MDVPFPARMLHIIDVFESLTSDRPYKKALSVYDALKIMVGENKINNKREARDHGMQYCFDLKIMQHFVPFLKDTNMF